MLPTPRNLIIFSILIVVLIFLFRLYCFRNKHKKNLRLIFFLYLSVLFFLFLFFTYLRIYFISRFFLSFSDVLANLLLCSVLPRGEMIYHSNSSSEDTEDSFGIGVLLEPWPVNHNLGLESSMINRIWAMENANSPFLLDKERGVYWAEIKEALDNCSSQREYNRLVEFENRDLQIRERKHESYVIFQEMLAQDPALAENAAYTPQECFIDFLNEMRKELDEEGGDVLVRDQREMAFLHGLAQDLRRSGPNSAYIKRILG